MANTQAYLPVGDKGLTLLKKGDIVEVITGEQFTFMEAKRTRWVGKGKKDGKSYSVPVYATRGSSKPYITKIVGKDKVVEAAKTDYKKFKVGQLFALEGHKETFMFMKVERRRTKTVVKGKDLASGKIFNIETQFTFTKVDVNKMKKELINA